MILLQEIQNQYNVEEDVGLHGEKEPGPIALMVENYKLDYFGEEQYPGLLLKVVLQGFATVFFL
jgi:hypothetical protein